MLGQGGDHRPDRILGDRLGDVLDRYRRGARRGDALHRLQTQADLAAQLAQADLLVRIVPGQPLQALQGLVHARAGGGDAPVEAFAAGDAGGQRQRGGLDIADVLAQGLRMGVHFQRVLDPVGRLHLVLIGLPQHPGRRDHDQHDDERHHSGLPERRNAVEGA